MRGLFIKLLTKMRPMLITGVMVLIILKIVALSPSILEEGLSTSFVDSEVFVVHETGSIVPGIPQGKVPEYSVDGFNYVCTQAGHKQWKLIAKKANLYNHEKIVHAKDVIAYLYNPDGKITFITGLEAKYFMDQRDLEVYGNVKTQFPDGFETQSEYLRYLPKTRKIEMPQKYLVEGVSHESKSQDIFFKSRGLDYAMGASEIILPKDVHFTMIKKAVGTKPPEVTKIDSDYCEIDRAKQFAKFTMSPGRPISERFVHVAQEDLFVRSRWVDLNYGDFSKLLNYMVAYQDVLIQEIKNNKVSRYGTGGQADFDTHQNLIVLKELPQVYQDKDTVTGDVIVIHRDTDMVEVEHSNAFSEGQP